jgi:hypothetical protein
VHAVSLLCLAVLFAQSQPPPAPPEGQAPAAPATVPPPLPAPQDALTDIEKSLAADAAAQKPSPPAAAPAPTVAVASSMNPDLSFIADLALAGFSTDSPLQTGGHDPQKNGFTLQQLEMSFRKAVDPYFRFDGNIVFSQFGVEVEEAYATTVALPASLQLRAGQFLTRFGRLNPTHPHAWDFVDQPFALGRLFGGEGNRGLGLELSYLTPLPWYVELVGSLTDAAGEGTARSFYGGEDLGVRTPADLQATVAAKQFFALSDDLSLAWGLSGAFGPNPTGYRNRTDVYGSDLYLKYRPITTGSHTIVSLTAEWLYRRRQVPGDLLHDASGYATLFWRFAQRWAAAVRYEHGSPTWNQAGQVGADDLDPFWKGHRQRVSAAATFWPTEFSRLRLQASSDHLGWSGQTTWAVFAAAEFVVGAHGAHAF